MEEWPGLIQRVGGSLHQESSSPPTRLQPALRTIIRHEPPLSSLFHSQANMKRLHRQNGRGSGPVGKMNAEPGGADLPRALRRINAGRRTWLRLHNPNHNPMNPRHQAISGPASGGSHPLAMPAGSAPPDPAAPERHAAVVKPSHPGTDHLAQHNLQRVAEPLRLR